MVQPDKFRTFGPETHAYILDMVAEHKAAKQGSQTNIVRLAQQENQGSFFTGNRHSMVWAHITETIKPATGILGDPNETLGFPVTRVPDSRTVGKSLSTRNSQNSTNPDDSPRFGTAQLYEITDTGITKRISIHKERIYNLAYHPIPIGWFVPVCRIGLHYYVGEQNIGWLLRTPSGGIPTSDGNEAGSAECEIWHTDCNKKRYRVEEGGEPVMADVLNWHPSTAIAGDTFVQGKTINSWIVVDVDYC